MQTGTKFKKTKAANNHQLKNPKSVTNLRFQSKSEQGKGSVKCHLYSNSEIEEIKCQKISTPFICKLTY